MVTAKQCGSNEISITDAGIKSIKVELLEHHLRFLAHCFNVELLIQADDSEQGNHLLQIFRQKGYVPLNPSRRCERIAVLNVVSMHLLDLACYNPPAAPANDVCSRMCASPSAARISLLLRSSAPAMYREPFSTMCARKPLRRTTDLGRVHVWAVDEGCPQMTAPPAIRPFNASRRLRFMKAPAQYRDRGRQKRAPRLKGRRNAYRQRPSRCR
jgi:hypothetical protein